MLRRLRPAQPRHAPPGRPRPDDRAGAENGRAAGEGGQAVMMIVLAALALMGTVPLVVLASTVGQLPLTTSNLNWNAAYEAAQAGLNDYLQQVDAEASYTEWTSGSKELCNGTTPVAAPTGPGNEAFCTWASSTTSTAPLTTNPDEWYEYSASETDGELLLTVSGKGGTGPTAVVRTFQYQVAPVDATLDDIYWTNDEVPSGCGNGSCAIVFGSSDQLYGPVFSNDDFNIDGDATFHATVTSADGSHVGAPYWRCTSGSSFESASTCKQNGVDPNFDGPGGTPLLGASEDILTDSTTPDLNPAKTLGCYISGPSGEQTAIDVTLSGSSFTWTTAGANTDPDMSSPPTASVQNSSSDPNSATACGSGGASVSFASLGAALFYVNGDILFPNGGSVTGFLTMVANNNIWIDGSIEYPCADITWQSGASCTAPASEGADTDDALGLIAAEDIDVAVPGDKSQSGTGIVIDAAMIAIAGSFENVYYTSSCSSTCPTLAVFGSIAQNSRGAVGEGTSNGTITNGFSKDYVYDTSLQTLWPPFFIPPAGATWVAKSYAELKPGAANEVLKGT